MTTIWAFWKIVLANFRSNAIQWSAMTWSWPNRWQPLKEEVGDEFEDRMSQFVDVMGPRIAAVKSDRQFLFDSKKLRVQREQNDSQAC